jgi:7-cyano-7-deazaguanine synthase
VRKIGLALAEKRDCTTLFVDYGQAAATAEDRASAAIANHYHVDRRVLRVAGISFGSGEIRGRNSFLVSAALLTFPSESGSIVLGIHAGAGYRDCDPDFLAVTQQSLDFHTGGTVALVAPFIEAGKANLFAIAEDLGVPVELTFSCEAGPEPCGECLSCRDRASFART